MLKLCSECGGDLIDHKLDARMGSRAVRYDCPECELRFESDASGMLTEVE